MPISSGRTTRVPRLARRVAAAVCAGVAVVSLAACTPEEQHARADIDEFRARHGRPGLALNLELRQKAVDHVQQMAAAGRLFHSDLWQGAPAGVTRLGENVSVAGDLQSALDALEASRSHRQTLLGPYTHVGVAVAHAHGKVWLVEVFAAF